MSQELDIPKRLQWLLTQRGISQNALARMSKVSPQTVSNTINNGRLPQSKTIASFARSLAVSKTVFDPKRMFSEVELREALAAGGTFTPPVTKRPAAAKRTVAKSTTTRKPVAKTAVKRSTTKPVVKKAVMAKKTTGRTVPVKSTTAKKPVTKTTARKTTAAKPVVRTAARTTTGAKRVARRGTTVAKGASAARRATPTTSRTAAARSTSSSRGGASSARRPVGRGGVAGGWDIDFGTVVSKLQKLANSRKEEVALDACKALLALR